MPTVCTFLPSTSSALHALGHHRHGAMISPRLDRTLHLVAVLDALLLRQLLADLDELLRLQDRVDARVLGPEVEVLGQPVGGGRRTGSPSPCRTLPGRP